MSRTVVFFHAHPDDEALLTAGTMARLAEEGHRVVLVVATRGEIGEAAGEFGTGDELAAVRMAELRRSAELLGVARVEVLGYADSGLGGEGAEGSGDSSDGPLPFALADITEAAGRLAVILRDEVADVVTSYDVHGGYGHPDHRQLHRVAARAAELAGTPLLLEATINRDLMSMGVELARSLGHEIPEEFTGGPDSATFDDWFTAADDLTHTIDVSAQLDRKRAAMEAHASQATSADGGTRTLAAFLSLPEEYYAMAFGTEWYRDPTAPPGTMHDDLFATLPEPGP